MQKHEQANVIVQSQETMQHILLGENNACKGKLGIIRSLSKVMSYAV